MIRMISGQLKWIFTLLLLLPTVNFAIALEAQTQNAQTTNNTNDETAKSGTIILPIASYRKETNVMLGAAMIRYFKLYSNTERLSRLNAVGMYTFNNQMVLMLSTSLSFDDSSVDLGFSHRNYPTRFYGIGNDVGDNYEEYTPYSFSAKTGYHYHFTKQFSSGFNYFIQSHEIIESEDGDTITSGQIRGTDKDFVSGLTLQAKWDTRKKQFYPSDSAVIQFSLSFFDNLIGSDYDFSTYTLDMRQYIGVSDKEVVAIQYYTSFSTGDVPFHMLANYSLRGFYRGKFIDRNIMYARIEYRYLPLFWRIGFVTFASIGEIANRIQDFYIDGLKYSYGFGVRIIMDRAHNINFRMDFAFGDEFSAFFAAMEMF